MTALRIINGAPVYACPVEGGTEVEFVLHGPEGAVVLRVGIATLGHLLIAGERAMQQARVLASDRGFQRQEEERHHAGV